MKRAINIVLRHNAEKLGGGDIVQAKSTAEELSRLGFDIVISHGKLDPNFRNGIVHCFCSLFPHESLQIAIQARVQNCVFVLSPIWHSWRSFEDIYRRKYGGVWGRFNFVRFIRNLTYVDWRNFSHLDVFPLNTKIAQKRLLNLSDMVLPNSNWELDTIRKETEIEINNASVIPNGLSADWHRHKETNSGTRRSFICVGRIEPLKNQLLLITAFKKAAIEHSSLAFVGEINSRHAKYAKKFLEEVDGRQVVHIPFIPHEELRKVLFENGVIVHASQYETTGLVIMEALSCGLVGCVTDLPVLREYYGRSAIYFDPTRIDSIVSALRQVADEEFDDYTSPTWSEAARQTSEAYSRLR